MRPIIVSFYTPNYREYAEVLKTSVEKFNFEHDILQIDPRGPLWIQNIYWRADFIKAMLQKHKRDVIWIDSDAEIKNYPFLFDDFKGDFGVYFHEWPVSDHYPNGFSELLGGTMYFSYNDEVLDLVDKWVILNSDGIMKMRSQLVLQKAVKNWEGHIVQLPASYTYVRHLMPDVRHVVVEHYQASGKFRKAHEEGFSDTSFVPVSQIP